MDEETFIFKTPALHLIEDFKNPSLLLLPAGTSFIHAHHSRVRVWIMIASSRSSVSGSLLVVDGFHPVSVDESHLLKLPSFTFLGRANNFRGLNFSAALFRWIS